VALRTNRDPPCSPSVAEKEKWSGRPDSNRRPLDPQSTKSEHDDARHAVSPRDLHARHDTKAHEARISDPLDHADRAVEAALGEALLRASRDGQHELVRLLVEELRARRLERAALPANVIPFPRR